MLDVVELRRELVCKMVANGSPAWEIERDLPTLVSLVLDDPSLEDRIAANTRAAADSVAMLSLT